MQHDGKNESPYRGIWVILLLLAVVPVVLYLVLLGPLMTWQTRFSRELNEASARVFGFGLGTVFHLSCLIGGSFRLAIQAVKKRVIDFFENVRVSLGFALECYWDDMRNDGVALILMLIPVAVCFAVFCDGLSDFWALWATSPAPQTPNLPPLQK